MRNRFIRPLVAGLVCLMIAASAQALPAPDSLTVDQAVQAALANNLNLKAAITEDGIKARAKDSAWNGLLPKLSVSATVLQLNEVQKALVPLSTNNNIAGAIYVATPNGSNLSLGLTIQEIISPATFALIEKARLDYQTSQIDRLKAGRSLTAAVRSTFYRLLAQKEAIELSKSRLASSEERLRQAEISWRLGQTAELNYIQNRVEVETLRPQLRDLETSWLSNLLTFQRLLGFDAREDQQLAGAIPLDVPAIPDDGRVVGHRLDLKLLDSQVQLLELGGNLVGLSMLPSLILQYQADPVFNGPFTRSWADWTDTTLWHQSKGALSLTLSWNADVLLPGSPALSQHAEIDDRLKLAREQMLSLQKDALADQANRRRSITASRAKIVDLQAQVTSSDRQRELSDIAYRSGAGRLLDLQAAELGVQAAKIQLLQERLNLANLINDFDGQLDHDLATL